MQITSYNSSPRELKSMIQQHCHCWVAEMAKHLRVPYFCRWPDPISAFSPHMRQFAVPYNSSHRHPLLSSGLFKHTYSHIHKLSPPTCMHAHTHKLQNKYFLNKISSGIYVQNCMKICRDIWCSSNPVLWKST